MMKTERKRYSSPFYRLFMGSSVAMVIMDLRGGIVLSNECFDRVFKSLDIHGALLRPGGRPRSMREFLDLRERSRFETFFAPLTGGVTGDMVFDTPVHREAGNAANVHWFRVHAWIIGKVEEAAPPLQGPFVGLVIEDETKIREEEQRLLEDRRIVEKAMEAKSQFLANMSHEIRTPIQTVIGMIELLQDTSLDREQAEYSRQIKFSAEVLLSLINDILDYSKIEAGKMDLEHADFDLGEAVEQAVEMISLAAHREGLEIARDIAPGAALMIRGDPNKFRQVVINLAKNAVKFTRQGGVTITVRLTELDGAGAVTVAVADTGIGVPEETRTRLFTTFMQADASTTRRFGGTGLGLAISRSLVELMHGFIEMVPNEGGGSIFRFTVPLEQSGLPPASPAAFCDDPETRVLVVDDRGESRRIIASYLRDGGCRHIESAASGEEALAVMRGAASRGTPCGLCFIDMIMPVMDGWRLAAEIHNDPLINGAVLILMVPHGLLGADTKMTLLKWFRAYINKPITRRNLAETIDTAMNEAELETLPAEAVPGETPPVEPASAGPAPAMPPPGIPVPAGTVPEGPAIPAGKDAAWSPTAAPDAAVSGAPAIPPGEKTPAAADRPLILIAEDHPVNQKLFSLIMDKLGYPSILADDGLDALEKEAANPVALILMDIQMPRMNGYEAVRKLRERGFTKPVIAVTASALSDERERCMAVGFDDILVKPFRRPEIEAVLNRWIAVRRGPTPVTDAAPSAASVPPAAPASPAAMSTPATDTAPEAAGDAGKSAAADPAVFDHADLMETFMNEEEIARSLLPQFIERTALQIGAIPGLAKRRDWESARREAHTIKGSALTMGGRELGRAAARLELAFKDVDRAGMKAAWGPVKESFARFRAAAEAYLAGMV
jgi:signal transduction histidine kinase/DNA-binding response OmpR family regulator/HPt (histidine-containing phosphotransfer) domain-containing protein